MYVSGVEGAVRGQAKTPERREEHMDIVACVSYIFTVKAVQRHTEKCRTYLVTEASEGSTIEKNRPKRREETV